MAFKVPDMIPAILFCLVSHDMSSHSHIQHCHRVSSSTMPAVLWYTADLWTWVKINLCSIFFSARHWVTGARKKLRGWQDVSVSFLATFVSTWDKLKVFWDQGISTERMPEWDWAEGKLAMYLLISDWCGGPAHCRWCHSWADGTRVCNQTGWVWLVTWLHG